MLQASGSPQVVHHLGVYYMFPGPAHMTMLHQGRDMTVLEYIHTVRFATACYIKLTQFQEKRQKELTRQRDEDESFRIHAANVERKDSEQGSSAQKPTKKPNNQKKKKSKGKTF